MLDSSERRTIQVSKRNIHDQETWRYRAELIRQQGNCLLLEAYFDREDMDLHGMKLARGDHFIEAWYTDRWYNVFEIHARQDDRLRGWYCNIGCPAKLEGDTLSYIDLALDLLVFPDGRQLVLDQDEFDQLVIAPETRQQALDTLQSLQTGFASRPEDYTLIPGD
jgi:protein associated with RNAse G/E